MGLIYNYHVIWYVSALSHCLIIDYCQDKLYPLMVTLVALLEEFAVKVFDFWNANLYD